MKNIIGFIISYLFVFLILIAAKFFEKSGKEASRKFIHIMLSNWWFIAMYFFDGPIWAAIVPATFIIINWISYQKNIINVMERNREERDGLGTVYYAISLFVLVIITFGFVDRPEIGLVSVLVMGYGDGLAAIIGRIIKSREYKVGNTSKTIAGSMTMFLVTCIIISIFLSYIGLKDWYVKSLIISIIITVVEGISIKGTDNLTVPIITCALLVLMI